MPLILPTIEDHPDFTRRSQYTTSAVLNVTATATTTPSVAGTFYTGGYESLLIVANGLFNGIGWVFEFDWFADIAATVQVGKVVYRTHAAIPIQDQVPNKGPICKVTVSTTSVTPRGYTLIVVPRTGSPAGGGGFGDGAVIFNGGSTVANNGTVTLEPFYVATGPAILSVLSGGQPWTAYTQGLDELSAFVAISGGMGSTGPLAQSVRINLPPYYTQVVLKQSSGGPVTMYATVEQEMG